MKKLLTALLLLTMAVSLFACGDSSGESSTTSGLSDASHAMTDTNTTNTQTGTPTLIPTRESNMVLATDQYHSRAVVYDMATYDGKDLENNRVWSYKVPSNLAGIRYRTNTPFGDVVIICGGGGYASIVSYPEGKLIWSTQNGGNNPHSVEILPDGNFLVGSSTGGTIRLFRTSVLLTDPKAKVSYAETKLAGTHGVLWDPEYNVLWALGDEKLLAYNVVGEPAAARLVQHTGLGGHLSATGGHALSADFTDSDYLWVSVGQYVYRYNKSNHRFSTEYDGKAALNRPNIKGVSPNPNGNFFYTYPNGGPYSPWKNQERADWCTDTIYYMYRDERGTMKLKACVSKTAAYYKVVSFYGEYQ